MQFNLTAVDGTARDDVYGSGKRLLNGKMATNNKHFMNSTTCSLASVVYAFKNSNLCTESCFFSSIQSLHMRLCGQCAGIANMVNMMRCEYTNSIPGVCKKKYVFSL